MKPRRNRLMTLHVFALSFSLGTAACATQWSCSIEPTHEFEVAVLSSVVETSQVAGTVFPVGADEWLESNAPTFSIWSYPDGEVTKLQVHGDDGRFAVSLPDGRYCFRASAQGFNSVVGRIELRKSARARPIDLRLTVAN